MTLSWAETVERVTRIELALSAWESDRSTPLGPPTSQDQVPPVPLADPSVPWLIARELHDLVRTSATKEDQPLALLRDQLLSVAIQTSRGGAQRRRLRSSVSVPCWSNSIA
jgi:hypothetical protein